MDPTVSMVTVLFRGALALALAGGGFLCVVRGARLIGSHLQASGPPTSFTFKVAGHEIGFTTGAAGTALVLISAVWVFGTITAMPSLKMTPGSVEVGGGLFSGAVVTFDPGSADLTEQQKEAALSALRSDLREGRPATLYLASPPTDEPVPPSSGDLSQRRFKEAQKVLEEAIRLEGQTNGLQVDLQRIEGGGDAFAKLTAVPAERKQV